MAIDRIEEWRQFSQHMEEYIEQCTIDKYKMDNIDGVDLISLANQDVCMWNILKYAVRCWNGKMKEHDLEKIAHYACFAWGMAKRSKQDMQEK